MTTTVTHLRIQFVAEARAGKFGQLRDVPVLDLLPDKVFSIRAELLNLSNLADDAFADAVKHTRYFRIQAARKGHEVAFAKCLRFRNTARSIEADFKADRKHASVALYRGDTFAKRLDGTHRLSVLRWLGRDTAPCIVVQPDEYAPWLVERGIAAFPKWYQSIEFLPGVWTKPRNPGKAELLVSMLPDFSGQTVLDIGCNSGLYTIEAVRNGARHALGIDRRAESIEQAILLRTVRACYDEKFTRAQFRVGDALTEPTLLDGIDALIACCVVYHLIPGLHDFMARVRDSAVKTLVLQGNLGRIRKLDPAIAASVESEGVTKDTLPQYIFDLKGLCELAELYGFRPANVADSPFPVGVFTR